MTDPTPSRTAQIKITVDAETASRFRALFPTHGARTTYLRRVIHHAIGKAPASVAAASVPVSTRAEIVNFRLYPDQISRVEALAAALGMKPGPWLRAVVSARLGKEEYVLPAEDRVVLNEAARILRKVGNNHNQLTQAARRAAVNGKPILPALPILEELSSALADLRSNFEALLKSRRRYWKGQDEE